MVTIHVCIRWKDLNSELLSDLASEVGRCPWFVVEVSVRMPGSPIWFQEMTRGFRMISSATNGATGVAIAWYGSSRPLRFAFPRRLIGRFVRRLNVAELALRLVSCCTNRAGSDVG